MNRPTPERQIYRMPGRLVVVSLACLYAVPVCLLAGGLLEAIEARGEPFFGLAGVFGMIWVPLLLLAIIVQLAGPPPPDKPDGPMPPKEPESR